jgi:serine/threonine protein kinase
MYSKADWKVLQDRYQLVDALLVEGSDQNSESWVAIDKFDIEYLVKLWPFEAEKANDLQRALWDAELRTMYRVGSSPGAEKSILVIREAGLDHKHNCFVMVMQAVGASGYDSLQNILNQRWQYPWLSNANIDARRELWGGLKRIADGIRLLHVQDILHRNVGVENVFLRPEVGPSSFRLGGFEWSIRVGEVHLKQSSTGWPLPPESFSSGVFGYQPETDWYGFGMLAVRCLLNVEAHRKRTPKDRYVHVIKEIDDISERYLSDMERLLLQRLIAQNRTDRLMRGYEIVRAIDDLLHSLGRGAQADPIENPLILAYNPLINQNLIEGAEDEGFLPNPKKPQEIFNPHDIVHCANLSTFIQQDLAEAQIYTVSENFYVLVGKNLELRITRLEERDPRTREKTYTWDVAYCMDVTDLRWNEGGTACKELPPGSVIVRTTFEVRPDKAERARAQNWQRYLPYIDESERLRTSLSQFHNFIRCANQIELLMRDAELFQYEVIDRRADDDVDIITIRETERTREVISILSPEGGLLKFLQREIESGKNDCELVVLTPEGQDTLRFDLERRIEKKDCFTVDKININEQNIVLKRSISGAWSPSVGEKGWLRAFGMFGQVALVRRRKGAIDRLENHSYLLRSLSATGQVFMDTGDMKLPQSLPVDQVDEAKQAVMRDVLRTRPIYALQGPPGTGKTTMVAHLLRQIFSDDPVAQVLITAQAHGAVDVLRGKVRNEAFGDVKEVDQPLAIRLGTNDPNQILEGSVESVALRVLENSIENLDEAEQMTPLQQEWQQRAKEMKRAITSRSTSQDAPEFCELVKRGANITYCTTSAGDLEELARNIQSFDWAIIEEAGKCHSFDLALPLQAGHRWLLIGDHYQLPPYRLEDYSKAFVDLNQVVEALKDLPSRAAGLLDSDWISHWESMEYNERNDFKEFARDWLRTFKHIFENCTVAPHGNDEPKLTIDDPIGAAAGMLSRQYRMHPTIGTLISEVYYKGELKNQTIGDNGQPRDYVLLPALNPESIQGVGIVWLDTPAASRSDIAKELGPEQGKPRYTNPFEADAIKSFLNQLELKTRPEKPLKLAVLSPYNQQVSLIRERLSDIQLHEGVIPKEELRTRHGVAVGSRLRIVHTVDSFQGNEADIILVSLVRNNNGAKGKPFGFLHDPERMNVLLSRAQRLLVLVGSWEFFCDKVAHFSLEDRSRREEWHLKKVITMLSEWFDSGKAVRIDAESLMGRAL